MKFSETEGTDISYTSKQPVRVTGMIMMLFLISIQTSFASDLNMFSNQEEVLAVSDFGGNENIFFTGVLDGGVFEAIQTNLFTQQQLEKSNSDGTGGGKSNSDGTGGKSNSDGTGQPSTLLTVLMECDEKNNNLAFGLIESGNGTETVAFDNVYLDGELMTCGSKKNYSDKS